MVRCSAPRVLGYARVSTLGQDLAYQLQKLSEAGCSRVFQEKRSGKDTKGRPELNRLLKALGEGDIVLATTTDRVARDPVDLLRILDIVRAAGANLKLLDEPFIDTSSEMADLMLFLVGWAARWQRKRILENTAHGRAMALARGVRFGRKPKLSPEQRTDVLKRLRSGQTARDVARVYNVSLSTIARIHTH